MMVLICIASARFRSVGFPQFGGRLGLREDRCFREAVLPLSGSALSRRGEVMLSQIGLYTRPGAGCHAQKAGGGPNGRTLARAPLKSRVRGLLGPGGLIPVGRVPFP